MTTRREHDAQTAILDDPARHWLFRPAWTCDADGQDWPCEPLRAHLLATMPVGDISLAMGAHYVFAARELAGPAAAVHEQLLGWVRAAR